MPPSAQLDRAQLESASESWSAPPLAGVGPPGTWRGFAATPGGGLDPDIDSDDEALSSQLPEVTAV